MRYGIAAASAAAASGVTKAVVVVLGFGCLVGHVGDGSGPVRGQHEGVGAAAKMVGGDLVGSPTARVRAVHIVEHRVLRVHGVDAVGETGFQRNGTSGSSARLAKGRVSGRHADEAIVAVRPSIPVRVPPEGAVEQGDRALLGLG